MKGLKIIGKVLFKIFFGFANIICILSVVYILLYIIYIIAISLMSGSLTDIAINCILFFGALIVLYIFSDMIL